MYIPGVENKINDALSQDKKKIINFKYEYTLR